MPESPLAVIVPELVIVAVVPTANRPVPLSDAVLDPWLVKLRPVG